MGIFNRGLKFAVSLAGLSFAAFLIASQALAANCSSLPYQLTNGQVADASQVMANFNLLRDCSNNNLAHNGANSDITSLSSLTTPLSVAQGGTGNNTGNAPTATLAASATKLATGRTISTTGDVTCTTGAFDGTGNVSCSATIPNGTVSAAKMASGAAVGNIGYTPVNPGNNLTDLSSVATARGNLGFVAPIVGVAKFGWNGTFQSYVALGVATSISRIGTGSYTITTLANPSVSNTGSFSIGVVKSSGNAFCNAASGTGISQWSTGSFIVNCVNNSGSAVDPDQVSLIMY